MKKEYLIEYRKTVLLEMSISLLDSTLTRPPDNPLHATEHGPFYLGRDPFLSLYHRTLSRCLYHSANALRGLIKVIDWHESFDFQLEPEATVQTYDLATKYEIEAFFAAIKVLGAQNLIAGNNVSFEESLIGKFSKKIGVEYAIAIQAPLTNFRTLAFSKKWHALRNSFEHLKPEIYDNGSTTHIELINGKLRATLNNIYYIEDLEVDLVEVFLIATAALVDSATEVRDLLTQFARQYIAVPKHDTIRSHFDDTGNMMVIYGSNGFLVRAWTPPYIATAE